MSRFKRFRPGFAALLARRLGEIALQQFFVGHGDHALGIVEAHLDQLCQNHGLFDETHAFGSSHARADAGELALQVFVGGFFVAQAALKTPAAA